MFPAYCKPGTFSSTGLEPCKKCPLHSFQPDVGGEQCLPCPVNETHEYCPEFIECPSNVTCLEGECVAFYGTVICQCEPGFAGDECDVNVDECLQAVCENNGTCRDGVNSYQCICDEGFVGEPLLSLVSCPDWVFCCQVESGKVLKGTIYVRLKNAFVYSTETRTTSNTNFLFAVEAQ